jgi:hypothetical protein
MPRLRLRVGLNCVADAFGVKPVLLATVPRSFQLPNSLLNIRNCPELQVDIFLLTVTTLAQILAYSTTSSIPKGG